jgi:hypothetical protein
MPIRLLTESMNSLTSLRHGVSMQTPQGAISKENFSKSRCFLSPLDPDAAADYLSESGKCVIAQRHLCLGLLRFSSKAVLLRPLNPEVPSQLLCLAWFQAVFT